MSSRLVCRGVCDSAPKNYGLAFIMNIEDELLRMQYKLNNLKEDIKKMDDSFDKLCYDIRKCLNAKK